MSAGTTELTSVERSGGERSRIARDPRLWLGAYAAVLAAIVLWPTHVDQDAGPLLAAITRAVPWLTYDVIEFSANVVMFVPLGVLLALLLPTRRLLVVPLALGVSVVAEAAQSLFLPGRTASLADIVANTLGAAVGLALVVLARALADARRPR